MTKKNKAMDEKEQNNQNISRRKFMGISGGSAALLGMPAWFPNVTFASSSNCPPCKLIKFFGRGGWDGMSICIPYGDPTYPTIRPLPNPGVNTDTLGFAAPMAGTPYDCLDLDGFFGLPTAMTDLHNHVWQGGTGDMAIVNAVGYSSGHSYSHFVGQNQLEIGQPNPPVALNTGWIGRHLNTRTLPSGCSNPQIRGLGFGVAKQRALVGGPDCIATTDPDNYNLQGFTNTVAGRLQALQDMYFAEGTFTNEVQATLNAINELALVNFAGYTSSVAATYDYPNTFLGNTFKAIAAMVVQGLPIETFAVDYGSWDHHSNEDPHNLFTTSGEGRMHRRMRETSEAFTAFYLDMINRNELDWLIFAMTEFGRTARENANNGTDHARGNCMFMVSPQMVNPGIYGAWPGLNTLGSQSGDVDDLDILTDIRQVEVEVVDRLLGNAANLSTIFPGFTPGPYLNFL